MALYDELAKIDKNFQPTICRTDHLSQVPELCFYVADHVVLTPYSLDFQKFSSVACCGRKRTPVQFRELAMQRQPTPRLDLDRKGHFLSRSDALGLVYSASAFTDLSDLPSSTVDEKKSEKRARGKRNEVVSKGAGVRSCEEKKVRAFITY